jgi:hypothetical protein
MEKDKVLFFLRRFQKEQEPVDHVAEAQAGTSYAERARKVAASEAEPSPEQQALETAIRCVEVTEPHDRVFDDEG